MNYIQMLIRLEVAEARVKAAEDAADKYLHEAKRHQRALLVAEAELVRLNAQEPVGYVYITEDDCEFNVHNEFSNGVRGVPLYAEPRPAVLPPGMTPKQASRSYGGEVLGFHDGYNQAIADAKALGCQPQQFVVKLPEKIPRALYQVIYEECGAFVDCDANPQKIWEAFRKFSGGEIAE